jgi:hypothetical protein
LVTGAASAAALRLPAAVPLVGAVPLDLAAVREGARDFFTRLADLAGRPEASGWTRLYYVLAGAALFAAGLAFRAVTRPPRKSALGPAHSDLAPTHLDVRHAARAG